jgi:phosphatidylcholine synthase
MPNNADPTPDGPKIPAPVLSVAQACAFAIHILTASGAALAFFALLAATEQRWSRMFAFLGVALLIDGVDGSLARRFRVATVLPRWSGDALDFVVDFATYVFVPAFAITASGLLPSGFALAAGALITMTGALYFADRQMKTTDNYFRGFPALWNIVAFYVLLLKPPPWLGFGVIVALAALSFVPFPFVHPIRVARLRALNIALMTVWAVLAIIALSNNMSPDLWVDVGLCAIGIYVLAAGLLRRR